MNAPRLSLPSDSAGFLVGQPIGDDEATRLLAGIKRDTGAILAAMRQLRTAQRDERRYRQARELAAGASGRAMSSRPVAVPEGRAGAVSLARDPATGRFVAQSRSASGQTHGAAAQRQARDIGEMAKAATDVARTAETTRRDAKADRASQPRGADGRFGSGAGSGDREAGQGGALGASASALAGGAGALLEVTEQVDPLLGAANEIKGLATGAKAVWEPIGRAGSSLFGNRDDSPSWLRRLWREFRAMRKDSAKGTKDTIKAVKGQRGGRGGSGEGGWSGLLAMLPVIWSMAKASVGGLLASMTPAIASVVARILPLVLPAAMAVLRRMPYIGAAILAAEAAAKLLERQQNDEPLVSARPGMEGMLITAANAAGVDPNLVLAVAKYESGMDPKARPKPTASNPNPTAFGLGQFTDETWFGDGKGSPGVVRQYGHLAGIKDAKNLTNAQIAAMRDDPEMQAKMLALHLQHLSGVGKRAFGKHDPAAVYGLHNLGETKGRRFLRALRDNPTAQTSSVLSETEIANNRSLYAGKTLGEAFAALGSAVSGASREVGFPRLPTGTVRSLPTAVSMPAIRQVSGISPVAPVAVPAMPSMGDLRELSRLSSAPPAPPATVIVQQPLGQDVRDRSIAHVVTGGIGGQSRR